MLWIIYIILDSSLYKFKILSNLNSDQPTKSQELKQESLHGPWLTKWDNSLLYKTFNKINIKVNSDELPMKHLKILDTC